MSFIKTDISQDSDFIKDLDKCAFQSDSQGIANCASERLLRSLDDLSLKPDIEILPGVSLLRYLHFKITPKTT